MRGGPGWRIRGSDLRPEITDLRAFREGMANDPLAAAVEEAWAGHPDLALDLLREEPRTPRVRALIADCLRDLGEVVSALDEYDRLVEESRGRPGEAVMRQHRGKVLLAAGRRSEAITDFEAAIALRRDAAPDLLASSLQALAVAEGRPPAEPKRCDD